MKPIYDQHGIRIYCGDMEDVVPSLGERFDAFLADPPYCSGGDQRVRAAKTPAQKYVFSGVALERPDFGGDQRDQRCFEKWAREWLKLLLRHSAPPAYVAAFIDKRQIVSMVDALQLAGWRLHELLPWDKGISTRPRKGWWRGSQAEYAVVGSVGSFGADNTAPGGYLPGVLQCTRRPDDLARHMHAKPVDVCEWLLQPIAWRKPGGLILDPFCGAGSSLVAARRLGLRAVGIERDTEIAQRAVDRLNESLI